MAGSGNPPAVIVQVIIGCVTAEAGLWHRGRKSPVFFFILKFMHIGEIFRIFSDKFPNYPLKPPGKWFIIPESMRFQTLT